MECAEKCLKSADAAETVKVCPQTETGWKVAAKRKTAQATVLRFNITV